MKYKNMQDVMKVTGIRLKELREEVGLMPTMLGKKCNKNHNVIQSIEKRMTGPSLLLLNELLIALGIEWMNSFMNALMSYSIR